MEGLDLRSGNNLFMEPLDDRGVVEDRYRDRGGATISAAGDGFADEAARWDARAPGALHVFGSRVSRCALDMA